MQLGFGRRFLGRFGRAGLPVGRCSADAGASCAASCEAGSSARRPRGSLSPGGSSVPGLRLLGAKRVAAVLQLARSGAAVLAKRPRMGKADAVPGWWIDNLPDLVRLHPSSLNGQSRALCRVAGVSLPRVYFPCRRCFCGVIHQGLSDDPNHKGKFSFALPCVCRVGGRGQFSLTWH